MSSKAYKFPLSYSLDETKDERYIKLRIKLCHDGENFNYSTLSKEAMEDAKNTIANIPILGHVIFDDNGKPQFGGHDSYLDTDPTGEKPLRVVYEEIPIGVIPETNNYTIKQDESGKSYVYVDGYVWRDYSNLAEYIINRDEEIKVSMEIDVKKYEIDANNDLFHIIQYVYRAVTMLGNHLETGMKNAKAVKVDYSSKDLKTFLSMKDEVNQMLMEDKQEERKFNMDEKKKLIDDFGLTENDLDFDIENIEYEELKTKLEEMAKEEVDKTETNEFEELNKEYEEYKKSHSYENKYVQELEEFKRNTLAEEVFARFTDLSDYEEFKKFKEDFSECENLTAIESKCYELRGRYMESKSKESEESKSREFTKYGIPYRSNEKEPYGGVLKQSGYKKINEK